MRVLVSAAAAIIACAATAQEAPKASVEAPKVPFTETRYGRTVDDPYRWMEDPKRASELARYVREQSNITIEPLADQIGSASCRERVCQYVSISVVAVSYKKKKQ